MSKKSQLAVLQFKKAGVHKPVELRLSKLLRNLPRSNGPTEGVLVGEEKEKGVHPLASMRFGSPMALGFAGINPLPHTLRTKLKYAEHVDLSGVTGALGLYVFNASSLYDPNYTGSGHQPRGFDQIMPLYDHFVVLRSHIKVQLVNTAQTLLVMGGLAVSGTVTNQGDWDDYAESPWSRVGALGLTYTSGHSPPYLFEASYDAKKNLGIPDPLTADKLQGTISANPDDNAFYHIFIQDAAEAATVSARALIEIEYDCAFIEPLNPAQS